MGYGTWWIATKGSGVDVLLPVVEVVVCMSVTASKEKLRWSWCLCPEK